MDLEDINKLAAPRESCASNEYNLIDYKGNDFNYLIVMELTYDDEESQRAFTDDDRIIHVDDVFVVCDSAALQYKTLAKKAGVYAFVKKLNDAIAGELSRRQSEKRAFKRWSSQMRSLTLQLLIYDFDLLDEALEDSDAFIKKHVLN